MNVTGSESGDDSEWVRSRVAALANSHRLSDWEQQILAEMLRGVHLKEIGARVGCSYASVRTHVRRMAAKLRCSGGKEIILHFFMDRPTGL